jgi:hypothetical protein
MGESSKMSDEPITLILITDAEKAIREVWRLATALDLPTLASLPRGEADIAIQSRQRALDAAQEDGLQALERLTSLAVASPPVHYLSDQDVAGGFGTVRRDRT